MRHNREIYDNSYPDKSKNNYVKPIGYDTSKPEFYNEEKSLAPKEKERTNKRLNSRRLFEKLFARK